MLLQRFTEHSIQESKGSTNPYINWPDIVKFEFDLPPLEQQRRIAGFLWTINRTIEQNYQSREATLALRKSAHKEVFSHGLDFKEKDTKKSDLPEGWQFSTVGEHRRPAKGAPDPGAEVPHLLPRGGSDKGRLRRAHGSAAMSARQRGTRWVCGGVLRARHHLGGTLAGPRARAVRERLPVDHAGLRIRQAPKRPREAALARPRRKDRRFDQQKRPRPVSAG